MEPYLVVHMNEAITPGATEGQEGLKNQEWQIWQKATSGVGISARQSTLWSLCLRRCQKTLLKYYKGVSQRQENWCSGHRALKPKTVCIHAAAAVVKILRFLKNPHRSCYSVMWYISGICLKMFVIKTGRGSHRHQVVAKYSAHRTVPTAVTRPQMATQWRLETSCAPGVC